MNGMAKVFAIVVAVLTLLVAACSSERATSNQAGPAVSTHTTNPADASNNSTTPTSSRPPHSAKATRNNPLAQRTFRVETSASSRVPAGAIEALKGYFDALVTAFARDSVPNILRRYSIPRIYANAQGLVDKQKQAKQPYVIYGAWVFTLQPRGATANVAVIDVCVNQRHTRRHDLKTDKAGAVNDTPYVKLQYTLNVVRGVGWVVVGYKGSTVASCPS